jgi:sRNA-binding carbon storage regulator CsrA
MLWLTRKIHLKWCEPKAVREYRESLKGKKHSLLVELLAVLFLVSFFTFFWWLGGLNPNNDGPLTLRQAIFASSVISVLLICVIPRVYIKIHVRCPSKISITDQEIMQTIADARKIWKYADIQSYSINSKTIDSQVFPVLSITTKKAKTFIIGIHSSVSLNELEKILSEKLGQ